MRSGGSTRAAERFAGIPVAAELLRLMRTGLVAPPTTSAGRLFDAAAALLGVRLDQRYEGQAAAELEALVRAPRALAGGHRIDGVSRGLPERRGSPQADRWRAMGRRPVA